MQNENPALPAGKAQEYIAPVKGKILSKFGEKTDSGVNKGIAIAAKAGTPVVATASGKVIYADYDAVFGNLVIIKLNNKNVITSYAHLEKFMINKGAQVSQGDVIGYVGNSGKASEPQLNFGIREGKVAQDPTKFINFGQKAPSQAKAPAGKAPANKAPGAKKPSAKAAKKNTGA
jgi:murein DD-endopeptidase MepM/ murein hydrolase activator NlpD